MRTQIFGLLGAFMLLLFAQSALAEKPYQTVHQRTPQSSNREIIQAQANEYFGGQFSTENDIVMNPVPDDENDSGQNEEH